MSLVMTKSAFSICENKLISVFVPAGGGGALAGQLCTDA